MMDGRGLAFAVNTLRVHFSQATSAIHDNQLVPLSFANGLVLWLDIDSGGKIH